MTRKKDHSSLLSTLEDIKKGAAEAGESSAIAENPPASPSDGTKPSSGTQGSSLLDALLSEVKAQADREVREVEKNLDYRVRSEKEARDEEERKKKEAFEKQIQEEARRRMDLVKKKEQDRVRKQQAVAEALAEEDRKREAARLAIIRRKRMKKTLVGGTIVGVAGTAAVLVLFLVIIPEINRPPSPGPGPLVLEQLEPRPHAPLTLPAVTLDDASSTASTGDDPAASAGIDGYGAEILRFVGGLKALSTPDVAPAKPTFAGSAPTESRLSPKVAEAFRVIPREGAAGGNRGGKDPDGFMGVDTSVFQDKKKKNK